MNKNGGFWEGGGQDTYANLPYGSTFTPPVTIIKEGSSFQGWFTDAAMTAANKVNGSITITNNTTNLYAKWQTEPDMLFKFLYHNNSSTSSNPYATAIVPYNGKVPKPDDPPPWKTWEGGFPSMGVWLEPFLYWSQYWTYTPWDFNKRVTPESWRLPMYDYFPEEENWFYFKAQYDE
jgi:uncharacterized repeat protein (TIGR02543 family)